MKESFKSTAKYIRISPIKAKFVADLIRKKDVEEAELMLEFIPKKAARLIKKVLKTAISDAENGNFKKENLYIKEIYINKAPVWKRWTPRARGMATSIIKPNSHITIILEGKKQ